MRLVAVLLLLCIIPFTLAAIKPVALEQGYHTTLYADSIQTATVGSSNLIISNKATIFGGANIWNDFRVSRFQGGLQTVLDLQSNNGLKIGAGSGSAPPNGLFVQGNVILNQEPTQNSHATTKFYVDAQDASLFNFINDVNTSILSYVNQQFTDINLRFDDIDQNITTINNNLNNLNETVNSITVGDGLWEEGSGDDIYRMNGNVGIGTPIPQSRLDVQGDARIIGNVNVIPGTEITAQDGGEQQKIIFDSSEEDLIRVHTTDYRGRMEAEVWRICAVTFRVGGVSGDPLTTMASYLPMPAGSGPEACRSMVNYEELAPKGLEAHSYALKCIAREINGAPAVQSSGWRAPGNSILLSDIPNNCGWK